MKATVVCFFASLTVAGPLPPPLESFLLSHVTDAIPGRYIVTLKTGTSVSTLHDVLTLTSHPPIHVYNKGSLHGFASELTNEEVTSLYNHPNVSTLEQPWAERALVSLLTFPAGREYRNGHPSDAGSPYRTS